MSAKVSFADLVARKRKEPVKKRKKPSDEEHRIQCACVRWFFLQHRDLRGRLFAVPNGGKRDIITAEKLLKEGVTAGVSDLILLKTNSKYGALLIEMKTPTGCQTMDQKRWQEIVCSEGEYKYVICRSLDDFIRVINDYLNS